MKKVITLLLMLCVGNTYAQVNNGKKLLLVATSSNHPLVAPNDTRWGCYLTQAADFYGTAHKYGFDWKDIDIVSPKGGKVPVLATPPSMWQTVLTDEEQQVMYQKLDNSLKPSEVKAADYNAVYYAGGYSCLVDFPQATDIGNIAASIYESGGKVGAVCDGIAGLISIKKADGKPLVDGLKLVTNGRYDKDLDGIDITAELAGLGGIISNNVAIITDQNLVTGKDVRPVPVTTRLMDLLGLFPTSIGNMPEQQSSLHCYPNPSGNSIFVSLPQNISKTEGAIYNNIGTQIRALTISRNEAIDVSSLPAGNYFIRMSNSAGPLTLPFVKL